MADLFSNYLQEGKSLKAETQRLTNLGIVSPAGKTRWNQATIRGILTNPVYTGTVYIGRSCQNARLVDGTQPWFPLVEVGEDMSRRTSKSGRR